ncbi:thioredoxin-like domain-containing protein [Lacinutrix chionoecetis]
MNRFPHFSIFFICLIFFNCKQNNKSETLITNEIIEEEDSLLSENSFKIKGITFSPNDTYIYLFKAQDDTFDLVDSTTVNNNTFQFLGVAETPSMYRISEIRNKNKGFSLLIDASNIEVFLNKRIDFSSAHSSSTIQKEYEVYNTQMTAFKDKGMGLYYNLKGNFSTDNIKKLRAERTALFTEQNEFVQSFIEKHPNSYFAAMLLNNNIETYNSKTLRSLHNGLSQDIKDLAFTKSLDSVIIEKEKNVSDRLPVVAVKKIEEDFTEDYRPKAYKISGLNPYGQSISLNSIPKGKVILVDFWASWCAPCRATNPTLVALHKKYKNQGFEILSVSEDKGEAEWLNAIAIDGLTWDYHVIDKNKSIAFRYGVESIPFKLLIDKQGRIASEKISGVALERRIQQLLEE